MHSHANTILDELRHTYTHCACYFLLPLCNLLGKSPLLLFPLALIIMHKEWKIPLFVLYSYNIPLWHFAGPTFVQGLIKADKVEERNF